MPKRVSWFNNDFDPYLPRDIIPENYVFNEYQNNDVWLYLEAKRNNGHDADLGNCDPDDFGDKCSSWEVKITGISTQYGIVVPGGEIEPIQQRYRNSGFNMIPEWILNIDNITPEYSRITPGRDPDTNNPLTCFETLTINQYETVDDEFAEGFWYNARHIKRTSYIDFIHEGVVRFQVYFVVFDGSYIIYKNGDTYFVPRVTDGILNTPIIRQLGTSGLGSNNSQLVCDPNQPCKANFFSKRFAYVIERYTPWKYQWADRYIQYIARLAWEPEELNYAYELKLDLSSIKKLEIPPVITYLTRVDKYYDQLANISIEHPYAQIERRFVEKRYITLTGDKDGGFKLIGYPLKFSFVCDSIEQFNISLIESQLKGKQLLYSEISQIPSLIISDQVILSRIFYANNNYWKDNINWKNSGVDNFDQGSPSCKFPNFPSEEAVEKVDEVLYELDLTKPLGEFEIDMPDSLRVLEIHQALAAQTFSTDEKGRDRVANLGYYIERIARILGISVNPDGSVRSIRQKKGIERGKDIPAGWNFGQWGTNKGGNKDGQSGGKPEEIRDGIVYENRCNKFIPDKFDKKKQVIDPGDFTLCENIPQLLDEILDDLDKALGWQELGAWAIPNADRSGKITYYEGLNALLTEIAYTDSKIAQISSQELVSSLIIQAVAYEILRAFGQPIVPKTFPFDIGEKEPARVPYPGLAADAPTQTVQTAWILENLSVVVGSLLRPKIEQEEKNK